MLVIIIISILSLGALSVSVDISKTVDEDLDLGSTSQCAVSVEYYGYYEGERVSVPFVNAPWAIENQIVDALGVTVAWEATGTYMDWSTLGIDVVVKIYNVQVVDGMPSVTDITNNLDTSPSSNHQGIDAQTGNIELSFSLLELLNGVNSMPSDDIDGEELWFIRVDVQFLGTCVDDYGALFTDNTAVMQATYTIYDAASGFDIDGNIT